ncbi:hypothetical protein A73_61 [Escherichia phage A73]|uniref:Uncharacterized protein n=1 Tax=Escherichia phage A73 TaxID=3003819 RepID=A0AAE9VXD0_9CAUD|nr:hypothetical protein A73_61 [Escherichia phage A73]
MMAFQDIGVDYQAEINITPSTEKGKILIGIDYCDREGCDSVGIRVTREQARNLANSLNNLADELFLQELKERRG